MWKNRRLNDRIEQIFIEFAMNHFEIERLQAENKQCLNKTHNEKEVVS